MGRGSRLQRIFTHYGRNNHTINTYFMKHDYLPEYHYKSQKPSINNTSKSVHILNIVIIIKKY